MVLENEPGRGLDAPDHAVALGNEVLGELELFRDHLPLRVILAEGTLVVSRRAARQSKPRLVGLVVMKVAAGGDATRRMVVMQPKEWELV